MRPLARSSILAALVATALALFAGPASAAGNSHPHGDRDDAVFVQTDNLSGNSIVAYHRSRDGGLTEVGTYPTGGLGGALAGAVVDNTASQGSLAYDRDQRLLYATNAGSDTITVFDVRGDTLSRRQVISSGGSFPVSITISRDLVYVLNARDGGSVQGFSRVGHTLRLHADWHRPLGLDPTQLPEFTHTPGQVALTPDGKQLVVTTKANGNNILVFGIKGHGRPSTVPTVNADPGAVPFAVAFDQRGRLAVAEAGTNSVALFSINRDGSLLLVSRAATGQAATCWIVATDGKLYVSNAGSASVSGYRVDRAGGLQALGDTATNPGTVDAAASRDGRFLYVQTGRNGGVDGFRVNPDGSLTGVGSVVVPGAVAGEGIVAT